MQKIYVLGDKNEALVVGRVEPTATDLHALSTAFKRKIELIYSTQADKLFEQVLKVVDLFKEKKSEKYISTPRESIKCIFAGFCNGKKSFLEFSKKLPSEYPSSVTAFNSTIQRWWGNDQSTKEIDGYKLSEETSDMLGKCKIGLLPPSLGIIAAIDAYDLEYWENILYHTFVDGWNASRQSIQEILKK